MKNRLEVRDHLLDALTKAQKLRGRRSDWIEYERQVMLKEVNLQRLSLSKQPLTTFDVMQAEYRAVGYVDYSLKYALYCMELVLDRD